MGWLGNMYIPGYNPPTSNNQQPQAPNISMPNASNLNSMGETGLDSAWGFSLQNQQPQVPTMAGFLNSYNHSQGDVNTALQSYMSGTGSQQNWQSTTTSSGGMSNALTGTGQTSTGSSGGATNTPSVPNVTGSASNTTSSGASAAPSVPNVTGGTSAYTPFGGGTNVNQGVYGLYNSILGRAPSQSEISYWATQKNNGSSWDNLAQSFATSQEAKDIAGGDNSKLVSGWYQSTLGRNADDAGLKYWTDQLRYNDPGQVFASFIQAGKHDGAVGYNAPRSETTSGFDAMKFINDPDNADVLKAYKANNQGMSMQDFANMYFNRYGQGRNWDGISVFQTKGNAPISAIAQQAGLIKTNADGSYSIGQPSGATYAKILYQAAAQGYSANDIANWVASVSGNANYNQASLINDIMKVAPSLVTKNPNGSMALAAGSPRIIVNSAGQEVLGTPLTQTQQTAADSLVSAGALVAGDYGSYNVSDPVSLFNAMASTGASLSDVAAITGYSPNDIIQAARTYGFNVSNGQITGGAAKGTTAATAGATNNSAAATATSQTDIQKIISDFMASMNAKQYSGRNTSYYQRAGYGNGYGASDASIKRRTSGWGGIVL